MTEHETDRYPAPTATRSSATGFVIGGLVCAIVALVFLPIIFGPVGAVLGFVGYAKGDKRGLWVGIGAIVATFAGMLIGVAVLHAMRGSHPAAR
jgi:amino acid permease